MSTTGKISKPRLAIYISESKEIPNITLIAPATPKSLVTPPNYLPSENASKLRVFEDYGLLEVCQSPNSVKVNRKSKISISDFIGEKNTKKLIEANNLRPLQRDIKKQYFIKKTLAKADLHRPSTPNIMDENTRLRLFLQKSRRDDLNKTLKKKPVKNSFSTSYLEGKTHPKFNSVASNSLLML